MAVESIEEIPQPSIKASVRLFFIVFGIGFAELLFWTVSTAIVFASLGLALAIVWGILMLIIEVAASIFGCAHFNEQGSCSNCTYKNRRY